MLRYSLLIFGLMLPRIVAADSILVLGDSLSAAYGFELEQGWVNLLQTKLANSHNEYALQIINASVSGETTAGGLARLPQLLENHQPKITILALGANDGLRGQPIRVMRSNLATMIEKSQQYGRVVLLGMRLPPNYGKAFTQAFANTYKELAAQYELAFVSFFIEGVTENSEFMQLDNYHPNAKAQPRILENVWPALEDVLSSMQDSK